MCDYTVTVSNLAGDQSGTNNAISWSLSIYNKHLPSQCNLTAQIEPVQNKHEYASESCMSLQCLLRSNDNWNIIAMVYYFYILIYFAEWTIEYLLLSYSSLKVQIREDISFVNKTTFSYSKLLNNWITELLNYRITELLNYWITELLVWHLIAKWKTKNTTQVVL